MGAAVPSTAQQALPGKSTGNAPDAILDTGRKRQIATPNRRGRTKPGAAAAAGPAPADVRACRSVC